MDTDANAITFFALIFLSVSLTIGAMAVPSGRALLGFTSAGAWLLCGGFCYGQSTETWDIMYCAFWLFMGMTMTMALMTGVFKEAKEEDMTADEIEEDGGEFDIKRNSFSRIRKRTARKQAKASKDFNKDGIITMDKRGR